MKWYGGDNHLNPSLYYNLLIISATIFSVVRCGRAFGCGTEIILLDSICNSATASCAFFPMAIILEGLTRLHSLIKTLTSNSVTSLLGVSILLFSAKVRIESAKSWQSEDNFYTDAFPQSATISLSQTVKNNDYGTTSKPTKSRNNRNYFAI